MYYILHGEDEFGRSGQLTRLKGQMAGGDVAMADLNTSYLDGRKVSMGELRHACDAVPFLADRRLVVVEGLLAHLSSRSPGRRPADSLPGEAPEWKRTFLAELADYLPHLPPTTRLVFIETESLPASHPILKLAHGAGRVEGAYVVAFPLQKDDALPGWVHRRALELGGRISSEAAQMLGDVVGPDLRLLDQEVEKLLLYVEGRQVTTEDVRLLVSRARETSVFDLVDCIGRHETAAALRLLRQTLDEGEPALRLLAMIARQVRILIQVKDAEERGLTKDAAAKTLGLHPYVVKKALIQAPRWSLEQLLGAHAKLVGTDQAIKTGELDENLALDLLVVDLTA